MESNTVKQPTGVDGFVGSRIRQARREMGLSQTDVANALGIAFQQIQKYEKGVNRVAAGTLQDIACVLRRDISYFFPAVSVDPPLIKTETSELELRDLQREINKLVSGISDMEMLHALKLIVKRGTT